MPRGADDLPQGPAGAALPDPAKSGRLRQHFAGSEFARLYRDLQSKFGPGVRILYFKAGGDSYGKPLPPGVPFSDPPPEPLGRKRK
jgi:hypothetical protein